MTNEQRSRAMSHVLGKETEIELSLRKILHNRGFRYKKNVSTLPGRPDIVLPKYKAVVFVNGCFWHGHIECRRSKLPEGNREFWEKKISRTIERDREKITELRIGGWRVAVAWQCCLNNNDSITNTGEILIEWLIHGNDWLEIP